MQCACTSTVLTRLPLITTSRRAWACTWPDPPLAPTLVLSSQLTKAKLGPVFIIPLKGISVPLILSIVVTAYKSCQTSSPIVITEATRSSRSRRQFLYEALHGGVQ